MFTLFLIYIIIHTW